MLVPGAAVGSGGTTASGTPTAGETAVCGMDTSDIKLLCGTGIHVSVIKLVYGKVDVTIRQFIRRLHVGFNVVWYV